MAQTVVTVLQRSTTAAAAEAPGETFFSNVQTGALLGFTATLIAAFGVWYLNKRSRRKSIRKAIVAELKKQEEEIDRMVESLQTDRPIDSDHGPSNYQVDPSDLPPAGAIPTSVFHANAVNLGELPSGKVESIVDYYSGLNKQVSTIEAVRNDEEVLPADKRSLHNDMPDLRLEREKLVDELNPWFNKVISRFRNWH